MYRGEDRADSGGSTQGRWRASDTWQNSDCGRSSSDNWRSSSKPPAHSQRVGDEPRLPGRSSSSDWRSSSKHVGDTALPTSSGDWRRSGSSEAPAPSQRAVNEPLLTSWIRDAGRLEDLERLVQQHGSSMVALHVAAAYTRLGKLPGRGPAKHILADRLLLQLLPPLLPALTVRQCDNIMGTMARMQHCHRGTLIALLGQLLGQLPAAEACNVASVLWSLAKLSRSTHSIEAAVEAAVTHHAAALSSLLRHLVSEDVLAAARPQDCAMALWALATLASSWSAAALAAVQIALQDEPGTVSRLLGRLTSRLVLAAANAQEASNATWALGKLAGSSATAAVAAVEAAVTQHAGALGSLLGYVTSRGILGVANPQDIANVLWALATLGSSSSPAAVAAMEGAVGQQAGAVSSLLGRLVSRDVLAAANPQDAGNVMWALATLGVSSSPAAVAAMRAALSQHGDALTSLLGRLISSAVLPAVKPQEAANVLWALAKLGSGSCAAAVAAVQAAMMQHASAVSAMLGRVVQKGRHSTPATPQGLATAIWSLAVLSDADTSPRDHLLQQHGQSGYSHLWQLLGALAQAVPSMGPQDVANSIWAASKLRVSSEGFAGAMQDAAAQQRRHMLPQQLASAALGAAVLAWGEPSAALVASMLQEAARRVRQQGAEAAGFLHQGLANLCVSVPVAQMPPSPQLLQQLRVLCDALAQHWDAPLNGDVLRREHPPQLLQLHMWLQASGSQQGTDAQPLLPEQLLQECEAAWFRQHSHITESSFEREVLAVLQDADCGVADPQPGQFTQPDGLMGIDIVGQHEDAGGTVWQVAVEVDGPAHVVRHLSAGRDAGGVNVSYRLDGSTQWRNAMLRHYGYALVMVSWRAWETCSCRAERVALLQRLVGRALLAAGAQPQGVLAAAAGE